MSGQQAVPSPAGVRVSPEAPVATCLNCDATLTGAFCAQCGQKVRAPDVTLRDLAHETFAELTSLQGKVPASLKVLMFSPGTLTRDVLAGRRARWLPPLRLYLICSVTFFLSGAVIEAITGRSRPDIANVRITNTDGTAATAITPEIRAQIAAGLPARLFGVERIERAFANSDRINQEIRLSLPKAMFLLVPIFALLTNVAWRKTFPRYPAHLYHALLLHAATFGAFTVAAIIIGLLPVDQVVNVVAAIAAAYALWYALVSARRVFGDPWPKTMAKLVVVIVPYLVLLSLTSLAIFAYAIFRI